jgi:hypothetical protein
VYLRYKCIRVVKTPSNCMLRSSPLVDAGKTRGREKARAEESNWRQVCAQEMWRCRMIHQVASKARRLFLWFPTCLAAFVRLFQDHHHFPLRRKRGGYKNWTISYCRPSQGEKKTPKKKDMEKYGLFYLILSALWHPSLVKDVSTVTSFAGLWACLREFWALSLFGVVKGRDERSRDIKILIVDPFVTIKPTETTDSNTPTRYQYNRGVCRMVQKSLVAAISP